MANVLTTAVLNMHAANNSSLQLYKIVCCSCCCGLTVGICWVTAPFILRESTMSFSITSHRCRLVSPKRTFNCSRLWTYSTYIRIPDDHMTILWLCTNTHGVTAVYSFTRLRYWIFRRSTHVYPIVATLTPHKPLWIHHRTEMSANGHPGGCSTLWQRGQGFHRSLPRSYVGQIWAVGTRTGRDTVMIVTGLALACGHSSLRKQERHIIDLAWYTDNTGSYTHTYSNVTHINMWDSSSLHSLPLPNNVKRFWFLWSLSCTGTTTLEVAMELHTTHTYTYLRM